MPYLLSKVKYLAILILLSLSSYNIVKTTSEIYNSNNRLEDLKKEVNDKRLLNASLKNRLDSSKTQEFVEAEARNKLYMVRPGEKILIPSEEQTLGAKTQNRMSQGQEYTKDSDFPSMWFALFFDNLKAF